MNEIDWISTANELHELTLDELDVLNQQECASDFKVKKLEVQSQKNWDCFYNRNGDNFFKDRHWTKRDLEILLDDVDFTKLIFLDAGCGVGNMLFPIASYFPSWKLAGFDFSQHAINILNKRASELSLRNTFLFDLTVEESTNVFIACLPKVDVLSLIFVLSAICPEKQQCAVKNLRRFLQTGGSVIVRDYGAFDHAMLRFGRGAKLGERFYARQDGTRAYFFKKEELINLFVESGYAAQRCEYLYKKTINRKIQSSVDRVFVQARFILK